jgi:hypothetical protein
VIVVDPQTVGTDDVLPSQTTDGSIDNTFGPIELGEFAGTRHTVAKLEESKFRASWGIPLQ